jgi:hypothetical protein
MERFGNEGEAQLGQGIEISDIALERLRGKFDDAIAYDTPAERARALENIITECAAPLHALEAGEELSQEYSAFLEALTKMHMLEEAHAKLEKLLNPTS